MGQHWLVQGLAGLLGNLTNAFSFIYMQILL